MAELHELIEKIENPELRAQIAEAAKRALKHKQFGLVFEEHLPECTPLYDIPVRKGLKVSVRNGKANETVLEIDNGIATCLPKNGKEAVQFAVADLVTTAELGDPILSLPETSGRGVQRAGQRPVAHIDRSGQLPCPAASGIPVRRQGGLHLH